MKQAELLVLTLAGLQMLAMAVDEFHFHHRRGLPRWERIGHPVDTLSTLVPVGIASLLTPAQENIFWYAGLAATSSIIITKDEFIHARLCSPAEHWLHAFQFVIHPVVLAAIAILWITQPSDITLIRWVAQFISIFLVYQIIYWNFRWPTKVAPRA